MIEIAVVVLNYENYWDTIECLHSLINQKKCNLKIIIVDNGSKNESVKKLEKFSDLPNITLIVSPKNLGFSNGNNIGICYATEKLGIKKILVLNNDTIIDDQYFFHKLQEIDYSNAIGAIGFEIIGSDGINQNPVNKKMNFFKLLKDFISIKFNKFFLYVLQKRKYREEKKQSEMITDNNIVGRDFILHGSAFLLTENYLEKVPGLYNKTFLYYEESILSLLFQKNNLEFLYLNKLSLYHKEDQSSKISFDNRNDVKLKFLLSSIKSSFRIFVLSNKKIQKEVYESSKDYLMNSEVFK